MASRFFGGLVIIAFLVLTGCSPVDEGRPTARTTPSDDAVRGEAAERSALAADFVVVAGQPLAYTRQVLPVDAQGQLVGEGSVQKQIDQVLENLKTLLAESGSRLERLAKVNVYADSPETINRFQHELADRHSAVRPAICSVISPLPIADALIAVDAVAIADDQGTDVALRQCEAVISKEGCADAAIMPAGGVVYLSGQADKSPLAEATVNSMTKLLDVVSELDLHPSQIVQLKAFVNSTSESDLVRSELRKLFPDQLLPPVTFVEWIASAPIEIEAVVHFPKANWRDGESLNFYTPTGVKPSPVFSRAALVQTDRQIFISGLASRDSGDGNVQVHDVFAQLRGILLESGSNLTHLAKATYYVSDKDASDMLNKLRPEYYDPERPPAASKAMVHGVGQSDRTISMDMIAVGVANEAKNTE